MQNEQPALISVEELSRTFYYDPISGVISKKGHGAILNKSKTINIRVKNSDTLLYRKVSKLKIAWALGHGAWSWFDVIPINGDYSDTRLCNLKEMCPRILVKSDLSDGLKRIDDLDDFLEKRLKNDRKPK